MAKLGNIFEGNEFTITQTPHSFDGAIDCIGKSFNILAPCDLKVSKQLYDPIAKTPYFEAWNNNFMLRFVHSKVKRSGVQPKGAAIGKYNVPEDSFADHVHVAIQINGKWENFMHYLDRSIRLRLGAGFGTDRKAGRWSYWGDEELAILDLVEKPQYNPKKDLIEIRDSLSCDNINETKTELTKVILKL